MSTPSNRFLDELARTYATYFDAVRGFRLVRGAMAQEQERYGARHGVSSESLDRRPFIYGIRGASDEPVQKLLQTSQGGLKERNGPDGDNTIFQGKMWMITVYALWEECYRDRIADELGLPGKSELRLPVFGDLRTLRNSILHNHDVALPACDGNTVLRWWRAGERIAPTRTHVHDMFTAAVEALRALEA